MKKILHIVGNRPQFIKLGPFLKAANNSKIFKSVIVNSGQHYDYKMAEVFFKDLGIKNNDYNFGVGSGTHNSQTGQMLIKFDAVLEKEKPDVMVVFGDTNTTLAGALAAYKNHIPLAHVEAGMREWVWRPEEINKKTADSCADFCFCPMQSAVKNLLKEGIEKSKIFFTGDITYDAYLWGAKIAKNILPPNFKYAYLTMHRAETVDVKSRLSGIVDALMNIQKDIRIIFPAHPRTKKMLEAFELIKSLNKAKNIDIIEPVGFIDSIYYQINSQFIITDSGGLQKEAFYGKKPCLVIDETTEYYQINKAGANYITGFETKNIVDAYKKLNKINFKKIDNSIFGNGKSAEKMIKILADKL